MKIDPLCKKCVKTCKQKFPAIVISCAKFIPAMLCQHQKIPFDLLQSRADVKRGWTKV